MIWFKRYIRTSSVQFLGQINYTRHHLKKVTWRAPFSSQSHASRQWIRSHPAWGLGIFLGRLEKHRSRRIIPPSRLDNRMNSALPIVFRNTAQFNRYGIHYSCLSVWNRDTNPLLVKLSYISKKAIFSSWSSLFSSFSASLCPFPLLLHFPLFFPAPFPFPSPLVLWFSFLFIVVFLLVLFDFFLPLYFMG